MLQYNGSHTHPCPSLTALKIIDAYQICHSRQPGYNQEDQSRQMVGIKHGSVDSLEKKASSISFLFKEGTYACTKRAVVFIYYVPKPHSSSTVLFDRFHVSTDHCSEIIIIIIILNGDCYMDVGTQVSRMYVCVCLFSHVNLQGRISYVSVSDSEL